MIKLKKRYRINYKNLAIALLTVFAIVLVAGLGIKKITSLFTKEKDPIVEKPKEEPQHDPKEDEITSFSFINVGDLLYHSTFIKDTSVENFAKNYQYVKKWFNDTDLVMGNYETTTNPNREYSGYPNFNTPANALVAIKDAGFDILNTNNNHTLDTGIQGVKTTLENARENGLLTVGTQLENEPRRLDVEVNKIKVGILSYSYGYNGIDAWVDEEDKATYLNYIDETKMEREIKESNTLNDFTLINIHWGDEYHTKPNDFQVDLAHKMSEWGADVILGSHPHVIQTAEKINNTYVIYSHGNFVSDQRLESLDDIETERGLITEIIFEKNHTQDIKDITSFKNYPTWVRKYNSNPYYYNVIPTGMFLNGEIDLDLGSDSIRRIELADQVIKERIQIQEP